MTNNQKKVLKEAGKLGASKGNFDRKYWRNFDQLERKGLIVRQTYTEFYQLTDEGAKIWNALWFVRTWKPSERFEKQDVDKWSSLSQPQ